MSQTPQLRPQPKAPNQDPEDGPAPAVAGKGSTAAEDRFGVPFFTKRHLLYLLGFTVFAAVLRLWNLGTWSFWIDEAHTFRDVTSSVDEFWNTGTSRYPVSFLLLRYLADWFGLGAAELTEEFMRLPFAFFGIASVPAIAIIGRGMIGRRAALLAALFLALSPWHIFWSQNARSYSLVLFLTVVGMGAMYNGIQHRTRLQLGLGIVMMFLAGLTHPSAFTVVAAAMAYVVFTMFTDREMRAWLGGVWAPVILMIVVVVVVALLVPVLQRATEVKGARFSLFHLLQTLVYYVGVPMLVAAAGGVLVLFDRVHRSAKFLTAMTVLPLLGLFAVSVRGPQTVSAQYAFAILPGIHMLAAVLVISLASVFGGTGVRSLTLRLVPLAIVVFHMLGQDYLYFQKEHGWRPRWAEAVQWIKNNSRGNRGRDLHVLTTNGPSVSYYFERDQIGMRFERRVEVESLERWESSLGNEPEVYLRKIVADAKRRNLDLWAVVTDPGLWEKDTQRRGDTFFREHFRAVRTLPNWTGPKDMIITIYHLQ